jgi:hypothetical protein
MAINLKTFRLAPAQCKRARGLLHWNVHDLSMRTKVSPVRIERFERNQGRLHKTEADEIVETLIKHNIEFKPNGTVILSGHTATQKSDDHTTPITSLTLDELYDVEGTKSDWGEEQETIPGDPLA